MNNKSCITFITVLAVFLLMLSCKKDKEEVKQAPESPKPTADFTYKLVSSDDPFTFKFENNSKDFKEIRWEFGDDTTTTDIAPFHTFINTGEYRVKIISKNDQGYWAQKETKIKLHPDSVLSFSSTKNTNGLITLALNSPVKTASISWYKGTGTTAALVEKGATTTISVLPGTYENYTVRITTPKGSKAELIRKVGSGGVLKDVTLNGLLSVSRDNDSGRDASEGSLKLVDNNFTTKFVQFNYKGDLWAQLDFKDNPVVLGAYSLTSGNDAPERDPKNFNLEGSNNLSDWTVLDSHINETFATRGLTKTYLLQNTQSYRYYRLNIPVINGAGLIQITEWRTLVMQ